MREKLQKVFTNQIILHILFWILALILLIGFYYESTQVLPSILSALVTLTSLFAIVYFNLYYLIPRYLSHNKLVLYIVTAIAFTLTLSPIRTLLTYYIYNGKLSIQQEIIKSHWAIFFAMLAILGISTLLKMVYDWFQQEKDMRIMENENMQSELRFLRSQINPHFLFNTLNSLYALTLKKSDRAPEIVIRLSEIMRYMLYECNDKSVPLSKEVDYIRNYLELERLRYNDKVDIHFNMNGQPEGIEIAPLLFTPFLENAFKHGVNRHVEEGFIEVQLNIKEDSLDFYVTNSKPEVDLKKLQDDDVVAGGIGLQNIKRRLELLYPSTHILKIEEKSDSYSISMNIKLN